MTEINESHLLWWVMGLVDNFMFNGPTEFTLDKVEKIHFDLIGAPAWVWPAYQEKLVEFPKEKRPDMLKALEINKEKETETNK